jgi:hypothetical protein
MQPPTRSILPSASHKQITPLAPHRNTHRNKKRALKRRKKVIEEGHAATSRTLFEHVQLADSIDAALDLKALPAAKGAYSARRLIEGELNLKKEYTLEELNNLGITVLGWDGR